MEINSVRRREGTSHDKAAIENQVEAYASYRIGTRDETGGLMRGNKYGAKKQTIDNHTFDSQAEANYYRQLKLLERAGEITNIELQPRFEIIPSYKHPITGRKIPATYYKADFRVTYKDGREEIIDVKGYKTDAYAIKKKAFEQRYGIAIMEVS